MRSLHVSTSVPGRVRCHLWVPNRAYFLLVLGAPLLLSGTCWGCCLYWLLGIGDTVCLRLVSRRGMDDPFAPLALLAWRVSKIKFYPAIVGFGAPPLRGLLGVLLALAPWIGGLRWKSEFCRTYSPLVASGDRAVSSTPISCFPNSAWKWSISQRECITKLLCHIPLLKKIGEGVFFMAGFF